MKPYMLIHLPKTGGTSLRVKGIFGEHGIKYDQNRTNITIVRDPVERSLSHFNDQILEPDLTAWFSGYHNYQTRLLMAAFEVSSLEEVKQFILDKKIIAIPTDKLTECMKKLGYEIGHENKDRKHYKPTKEEIELIESNSKQDRELYEWIKTLNCCNL